MNKFERGDEVYYMYKNHIRHGIVRAVFEMDEINTKYLIAVNGHLEGWVMDCDLFASIKDLFDSLRSCIEG